MTASPQVTTGRYARHHLIDWFDQERLQAARVLVVGAGAVGNEVLKNLALLGIGSVHILDPDTIEEHNLTRSVLFAPTDLGRPKAEVAAHACARIHPAGVFSFEASDFWSWATLSKLDAFDAVICTVDNFEARLQLNRLCRLAPVDFFNAGVDSRSVALEAYPFRSEPGCGCYECWIPDTVHTEVRRRYSCGGLRHESLQEKKIPTTAVTASFAGAGLIAAVLNRLCRHRASPAGSYRQYIDTVNPAGNSMSTIAASAMCPTCAMTAGKIRRYPASGQLGSLLGEWQSGPLSLTVTLAEPLLVATDCTGCGDHRDYLEPAAWHSTRLARCRQCGMDRVRPRITDRLSLEEIVRFGSNRFLPVKFVSFACGEDLIVLEIEGLSPDSPRPFPLNNDNQTTKLP